MYCMQATYRLQVHRLTGRLTFLQAATASEIMHLPVPDPPALAHMMAVVAAGAMVVVVEVHGGVGVLRLLAGPRSSQQVRSKVTSHWDKRFGNVYMCRPFV